MPTNGGGEFSPAALAHKHEYHRAKRLEHERRQRELSGLRSAEREAATARRRQLAEWRKAEKRTDQELLRELRDEVQQKRIAAREGLRALRDDPVYHLYKRWGQSMQAGTLYDAEVYHRTGKLSAVTDQTRYRKGGSERRPVLDYTDILDREVQELGLDIRDLPQMFDRTARQMRAAQADAADAERARLEADDAAKQLRRMQKEREQAA